MAARSRRLPLTDDTRGPVNEIIHFLDQAQNVSHCSSFEMFTRALDVFEAALRGVSLNQWMNEVTFGLERALVPLSLACRCLILQAFLNYRDIIGLVYMQLGFGNPRTGQYFTPYHLAKFAADVLLLSDIEPPKPGAPPITILDPCCGSGVFLLTAMEIIEKRYPDALDDGSIRFHGLDIDPTCVRMARVNTLLHHFGRYLRREVQKHPELVSWGREAEFNAHGVAQGLLSSIPEDERHKEYTQIRQRGELSEQEQEVISRVMSSPQTLQLALPLGEEASEQGQYASPFSQRSLTSPPGRRKLRQSSHSPYIQGHLFATNEPLFSTPKENAAPYLDEETPPG